MLLFMGQSGDPRSLKIAMHCHWQPKSQEQQNYEFADKAH
jgi:hypothetical protein